MERKAIISFWALVLFFGTTLSILGQTESSALDSEVSEAEAKMKIAEAKKKELEAKFPAPDADSLKATNSVEGKLIESRIQAYRAMERISQKIAAEIKTKPVNELYIFRETDYAKIVAYKKLMQYLAVLNGEYAKCAPGGVGAKVLLIGALASTFLSWLPLIKTDTTIKADEFDIEEEAVWASLTSALSNQSIYLRNPFVSKVDFLAVQPAPNSAFLQQIEAAEQSFSKPGCNTPTYALKPQVDAAFMKLKKELGLEITVTAPESKKTVTSTKDVPPDKTVTEISETTPAVTKPQNNITFLDLLLTEQTIARMTADNIYWLKIKNSKSGGNMRIKSNPLIDIFRGGSSIRFSGGSLAYYYVFDNDGNTILSGIASSYEPYKKSSQISN